MAIEYRSAGREIWDEMTGRSEETSWGADTVIGDEADSAGTLLALLFGDPVRSVVATTPLIQARVARIDFVAVVNIDLHAYRANDMLLRVAVQDDSGAPVDLTGCDLLFILRDRAGKLLASKRRDAGITITDLTGGLLEVALTHIDTTVTDEICWCELAMADVEGHRYTILTGTITFAPSWATEVISHG